MYIIYIYIVLYAAIKHNVDKFQPVIETFYRQHSLMVDRVKMIIYSSEAITVRFNFNNTHCDSRIRIR